MRGWLTEEVKWEMERATGGIEHSSFVEVEAGIRINRESSYGIRKGEGWYYSSTSLRALADIIDRAQKKAREEGNTAVLKARITRVRSLLDKAIGELVTDTEDEIPF